MAEYYFLASLLPQLEIGHVPTLGFEELKELLRTNLTKEDAQKVKTLLRMVDMENMRRVFAGEKIDPRGNLNAEELKEALHQGQFSDEEEFPPYLQDFLEKYKTNEERIAKFPQLMGRFLLEKSENEEGFLGNFFAFEREMRIVMAGFRAKKMHKNIEAELQFEESSDPIVAQVIAQKDTKTFEPPFEYKELKPIFDAYGNYPSELHKALTQYRFDELQEMMDSKHFSIDRILGYVARLILAERWIDLNYEEGMAIIDTIERSAE